MGERIYTAEEAEALAAAATPEPWLALEYARNDAAVIVEEMDPDKHEHPGALLVGQTDARDARLMAAAPDLARSVAHHVRRAAELEAEVRRLQAHNSRMSRAWEEVADACKAAGPKWWEHECGLLDVVNGLPGNDYKGTAAACRALARGEVSDG